MKRFPLRITRLITVEETVDVEIAAADAESAHEKAGLFAVGKPMWPDVARYNVVGSKTLESKVVSIDANN